jgi:hypothetical protein
MTETTIVKKKKENEIAVAVDLGSLIADSMIGKENIDKDAITIPNLVILQDKCKQVTVGSAKHIPGAKAGNVLNTVTGEALDLSGENFLNVIPVGFRKAYIEWGLLENGGGWKGEHPFTDEILKDTKVDGKNRIIRGTNQLVETCFHYVLIVRDSGTEIAVIPMKSTSVKVSRKWCTMLQTATCMIEGKEVAVPSFANSYKLSVGLETNAYGSWYNYKIQKGASILGNAALYNKAKGFAEMVSTGKVEIAGEEEFDGTIN